MNISDEVIIATVSSVVVGFILKTLDFFIRRGDREDEQENQKISDYHKSVEAELSRLSEENRRLREEADRYRTLYLELLEKIRTGIE